MLVLLIGDLHVPNRSAGLPEKFRKLLVPGKIAQILSTGNLTDRDTYDFLRRIAPDMHLVRGEADDALNAVSTAFGHGATSGPGAGVQRGGATSGVGGAGLPTSKVVTLGQGTGAGGANFRGVRVGLCNGYTVLPRGDGDALLALARQLDVDVLVWGGTHRFEAYELEGRFFVNPGSATGAPSWGPGWSNRVGTDTEPTPSFVLMDIQGNVLVLYVYQLIDGEVKVEKFKVSQMRHVCPKVSRSGRIRPLTHEQFEKDAS